MAGEEFNITATADCVFPNPVDLVAISYDKGIELIANPDFYVELGQTTLDKGFQLIAEANLDVTLTPTVDVSITGIAEVFNQIAVTATPAIDLSFHDLNCQSDFTFTATPTIDKAVDGFSDASFDIFAIPTIDKAITDGYSDAHFEIGLDRLLRSLFTAPPDAEISILKYMTSDSAETLLDGSTIEAGVTTILNVHVLGSRLDTYLIEFFVRTRNDAIPVIYKSSSGTPGGIRLIGINSKATPSGTLQELIAQIILETADTNQFDATTVVNYECRMSHKGFGEDYRIAPKKERGETGLFTISKY